jgi:hypothetical protein
MTIAPCIIYNRRCYPSLFEAIGVNVHSLAQAANWRSLVKTSLELQSCSLFQIKRLDQNLGLLPLAKSIYLKEGTRLQLQRRFYQTAPVCSLRQIVYIDPILVFLKP